MLVKGGTQSEPHPRYILCIIVNNVDHDFNLDQVNKINAFTYDSYFETLVLIINSSVT